MPQSAEVNVKEIIDLRDVQFHGATLATWAQNGDGGTLTVENFGPGAGRATLQLLGHYSSNSFIVNSDGQGGTEVTLKTQQSVTSVNAQATSEKALADALHHEAIQLVGQVEGHLSHFL